MAFVIIVSVIVALVVAAAAVNSMPRTRVARRFAVIVMKLVYIYMYIVSFIKCLTTKIEYMYFVCRFQSSILRIHSVGY